MGDDPSRASSTVQATAKQGKKDIPYTSDVVVHLDNSSTHTYQEEGATKNVPYSEVYVDVERIWLRHEKGKVDRWPD